MDKILSQIKRIDKLPDFQPGQSFEIVLLPDSIKSNKLQVDHWYDIEVKSYMCESSKTPNDFMMMYNNNRPMPYNRMSGKVIKDHRSMVYMKLHNSANHQIWEGWIVKRAIIKYREIQNG